MFLQRFKPSEIISSFVDSYLIFEDDGGLKGITLTTVPSGVSEIAFHFGDPIDSYITNPGEVTSGYIYGPHTRPGFFTASGYIKCLCVLFKPWGAYRIFGISQQDVRNYAIELDLLCGRDGERVLQQVLTAKNHKARIKAVDTFLVRQFTKTKDSAIKIYEAVSILQKKHGSIRIKDLSSLTRISVKTLERNFKDTIGLTPKEYAGIMRLYHVYNLVRDRNDGKIYDVIYNCGYYDQSHFINDVKRYTGLEAKKFIFSTDDHVIYLNRMYTY